MYVVYRCHKCGKAGISQVRTETKLEDKTFKCLYCNKSSVYSKVKIIRQVDNPGKATNIARRYNLNEEARLSIEEKKSLAKKGEGFN